MSRTGANPFLEKLVMICAENLAHASGLKTPSVACVDVAALTHSAYHRLSARPDFQEMQSLLAAATKNIAATSVMPLEVQRASRERENTLRHQYVIYKTNAGWLRPVARFLRNFTRRLLRAVRR